MRHRTRTDVRHVAVLAVTAALTGLALPAVTGDHLVLKNGGSLTGDLLEETGTSYTIQVENGTITVRKSEVLRHYRSAPLPPAPVEKTPPSGVKPPPIDAPPSARPAAAPRTTAPPPPRRPDPPAASASLESLFARYFEKKDLSPSALTDALRKIGAEAIPPSVEKARSQAGDRDFADAVLAFVEKTPSLQQAGALATLAKAPFLPEVRTEAIAALGRVGDADAARALVQLIQEDRAGDMGPSHAQALKRLAGKPGRPIAAESLERVLRKGGNELFRSFAIQAYVALASRLDTDLLRDLASSGPDPVRVAALVGLGQAATGAGTTTVADALRNGSAPVQRAALFAAGRMRAWELVQPIIGLLADTARDANFKALVGDALGRITNQTFGPDPDLWRDWWENNGKILVQTGGELSRKLSGDTAERIQALQFIGANRCDLWLDAVGDALDAGTTTVRVEAARTMGRIRSPRGVPPLLRTLSTTDAAVRDQAANALEQILGLSLGTDEVLWKAWWDALPEQRSGKTAGLVTLMDHPDRKIRHAAVRKLGEHLVPESGAGLIRALRDEDTTVAEEACRVLGALNSREAVPPLMDALLRDNDALRSAAVSALRTITGQTWTTHDEWSQWWKQASR